MTDKTGSVYGNRTPSGIIRKAEKQKRLYQKRYGDDTGREFHLGFREIPVLKNLGVREIHVGSETAGDEFSLEKDPRALVIGNIRMGFGHYRISMAIASAAKHRGLNPYWFDLHSFSETAGGKIISKLNSLYSLGSRLSQKYPLFNRLYWEPLNSEGFRKLSYNAADQKTAELMAAPCTLLPKKIPYIATHAWPSQAAVHAGLERVVNVIPDNWPMALHLSEGALHCIQSPSSWFGYRTLRGMRGDKDCRPMPPESLFFTGHYIDHEIVSNISADTEARLERLNSGAPLRILLTVGGAGAQRELFAGIISHLMPLVRKNRVSLLINVGDHNHVLEQLTTGVPELAEAVVHADRWDDTENFADKAIGGEINGTHVFYHNDIFAAVYTTNLLMRVSDLLVTKPSELAYYPVPKLHMRRIGGHEAWGAIRSAEIGDGTVECMSLRETLSMLDLLINDSEGLEMMNGCITAAGRSGIYNGAYRAVDIALGKD